jgi:hypothetical protein
MRNADIGTAIEDLGANPLVKCKIEFVSLQLAGVGTSPVQVHAMVDTCLPEPMMVPSDMVQSLALPAIGRVKKGKPNGNTKPLLVLVEVHYAGQKKMVPATVGYPREEVMIGLNFLRLFGQKIMVCKASATPTDLEDILQ